MEIGNQQKEKILMKFITMVELMSKVEKLMIGRKSEYFKTFMLIPLCNYTLFKQTYLR